MTDKTATLEELREMRKRGEIKPTLDDAPEAGTPEGFWDDAIPSKHLGGSQSILDAAIEIAIEDQARIAELEAALTAVVDEYDSGNCGPVIYTIDSCRAALKG
jgi:hypothetical protein